MTKGPTSSFGILGKAEASHDEDDEGSIVGKGCTLKEWVLKKGSVELKGWRGSAKGGGRGRGPR